MENINLEELCLNVKRVLLPLMEDGDKFDVAFEKHDEQKVTFFLRGTIKDVRKIAGNDASIFRSIKTLLSAAVKNKYQVKVIVDVAPENAKTPASEE